MVVARQDLPAAQADVAGRSGGGQVGAVRDPGGGAGDAAQEGWLLRDEPLQPVSSVPVDGQLVLEQHRVVVVRVGSDDLVGECRGAQVGCAERGRVGGAGTERSSRGSRLSGVGFGGTRSVGRLDRRGGRIPHDPRGSPDPRSSGHSGGRPPAVSVAASCGPGLAARSGPVEAACGRGGPILGPSWLRADPVACSRAPALTAER